MKEAVVGFLFSENLEEVLLIKKARPDWQRGKLNGVGGKIEKTDASPAAAMAREFEEETGMIVPAIAWEPLAIKTDGDFRLYSFWAIRSYPWKFKPNEDEPLIALMIPQVTHQNHFQKFVDDVPQQVFFALMQIAS
jgi:8-oxo-dGTP diphosphatase